MIARILVNVYKKKSYIQINVNIRKNDKTLMK